MSQDNPKDPTPPGDAAATKDSRSESAGASAKPAEPEARRPVHHHAPDKRPQESGAARLLRRVDSGLGLIEQALLAVFLVVLVGIGVVQAVMLKFDSGLGVWSFELLRYAVFFIAMTGAALSAHTGQLIAMDFVTRLLAPTTRARLQVLLQAFTLAICGFMVKGGFVLADSVQSNSDAALDPHLGIMALPIGAGLMGAHILLHMLIDLTYLVRGELPPYGEGAPRSGH